MECITRYNVHRRERQDGRQGGGVAVYVKQGISCSLQPQFNHASFRSHVVTVSPMPREISHLLIGAVYHPPKANNAEMMDYLIRVLDTVNRDHPNLGILLYRLYGDFNQLPEFQLRSYALIQLIRTPTRERYCNSRQNFHQRKILVPVACGSTSSRFLRP